MMGPISVLQILQVLPGQEPGVASALTEPARLALLLDGARRTYTDHGKDSFTILTHPTPSGHIPRSRQDPEILW